jgi:hypothetical protein
MPIDGYHAICTNLKCKKGRFGFGSADKIPNFCWYCAAEVIRACPHCQTPITELWDEGDADQPNACGNCGEVLRREIEANPHATIRAVE